MPDLILSGHSGLTFDRRCGDVRWINAGVIGMPPHDGSRQTCYAILDRDTVSFHRLDYNWQAAQDAMRKAGLLLGYDATLETGWWPSEDVLPQPLRRSLAPARG